LGFEPEVIQRLGVGCIRSCSIHYHRTYRVAAALQEVLSEEAPYFYLIVRGNQQNLCQLETSRDFIPPTLSTAGCGHTTLFSDRGKCVRTHPNTISNGLESGSLANLEPHSWPFRDSVGNRDLKILDLQNPLDVGGLALVMSRLTKYGEDPGVPFICPLLSKQPKQLLIDCRLKSGTGTRSRLRQTTRRFSGSQRVAPSGP